MTYIEMREGPTGRLFLQIHADNKATLIIPVDNDGDVAHLALTIDSPTPIEDRGEWPFEILCGGAGERRYVFVDIEELSVLVSVNDEEDLQRLEQSIESPVPLRRPGTTINRT